MEVVGADVPPRTVFHKTYAPGYCVVDPALPCSDDPTVPVAGFVGCLALSAAHVDRLQGTYRRVRKADPRGKFTVVPARTCACRATPRCAREGGLPTDFTEPGAVMTQFLIPRPGDVLLGDMVSPLSPTRLHQVVHAFGGVLHGLKRLRDADVVHRCIGPTTLAFSEATQTLRLFEFSGAGRVDEVMEDGQALRTAVELMPPELAFAMGLASEWVSAWTYTRGNLFSAKSHDAMIATAQSAWTTLLGAPGDRVRRQLRFLAAPKLDMFTLSATLYRFLRGRTHFVSTSAVPDWFKNLRVWLNAVLDSDWTMRPSLDAACLFWDKMWTVPYEPFVMDIVQACPALHSAHARDS